MAGLASCTAGTARQQTIRPVSPRPLHFIALTLTAGTLLFAGCRTAFPGASELRTVHETRVLAVQENGRLALRFRLKGRDAYAVAALPTHVADAQTALDFATEAKDIFSKAKKHGRPVTVLGTETWRSISRTVAAELAPPSPRQAVLVTAADRELLVCRNAQGVAAFLPLTSRQRGVKIVRRLNAQELIPRFTAALASVQRSAPGGEPVLILTGHSPAMVLVDSRAPRLTFISAPPEQMFKLPLLGLAPDVTVRGLLSVGLRSGAMAVVKNPVTTTLHAGANLLSMADAAVHGLLVPLPSGPPPPLAKGPPMDIAAWEKHLDRVTGKTRVPATVRLSIDGEQFFPEFIQAIQEARESIDVLLYIFDTDDYAIQIADLLKQRSHEVRVRVMIDEAASLQSALLSPESPQAPDHRPPGSIVNYLRAGSKMKVRPMAMPAFSSTHSKMIIIDGNRAWLGGMNIGREYRCDWHDMMIEVTGPIIGPMQRSFAQTWAHHGWSGDAGELIAHLRSNRTAARKIAVPPGAIPVRPLHGGPLHSDLRESQFAALRNARRLVWLENAYLTDSRFLTELVRARYRGVDVRVIMPMNNDNPLMKANNKARIPALVRHGVRVWLLPGMSHVKAALYDGWACTGSANFDRLSFHVNSEFNIGYSDPETVDNLRRELFLKDMAAATEVTETKPGSLASQITDALVQTIAGQF